MTWPKDSPSSLSQGLQVKEEVSNNGIISKQVKEGGPLAANQTCMSAGQPVPEVVANPTAILEPDLSLSLLLKSLPEGATLLAMRLPNEICLIIRREGTQSSDYIAMPVRACVGMSG